jgi:hypothetical protein
MSEFTDYCAAKGRFKLRIWLKRDYATEATGITERNDPFVDKYSFPKLDVKDEEKSIERLARIFLRDKYFGKYRFAQVFQDGKKSAIKTIKS